MWTHRRSGQLSHRGQGDHRDPYERDRTRVIHSAAFRRLQRKTQILRPLDGDFHRTRLTHSLEVASIGCSILRQCHMHHADDHAALGVLPHEDLIHAICLLHDIGHPPFGHGGEAALNYCMREHGGFESNAQTLHLVSKTEGTYGKYGLDLTRRTMLGILKYPASRKRLNALAEHHTESLRVNDYIPPKAFYDEDADVVSWLLAPFNDHDKSLFQTIQRPEETIHGKTLYHSFDCSLMDLADNIAYGVHDLEDAIHLKLIQRDTTDTSPLHVLLKEALPVVNSDDLINQLFSPAASERKYAIGALVNLFITTSRIKVTHPDFDNPLMRYTVYLPDDVQALLTHLKDWVYTTVIDGEPTRAREHQGQQMLLQLFEACQANPADFLDEEHYQRYSATQDDTQATRIICNQIANLTDDLAKRRFLKTQGLSHTADLY